MYLDVLKKHSVDEISDSSECCVDACIRSVAKSRHTMKQWSLIIQRLARNYGTKEYIGDFA